MVNQIEIELSPRSRGIHLITDELTAKLGPLPEHGLLNIFIQHTSAGLCINENADPTVRGDLEKWFDKTVRENEAYYEHTYEGPDDMPAHIKSMLTGNSLTIPITHRRLNLGTWQGIYLCEFRNSGGRRKLIMSLVS